MTQLGPVIRTDTTGRASVDRWWQDAVIYQIYPRSFCDANGDGVGDLAGVIHRLDHVADLGVDAIWMNPFYPSPMVDGGYDITDHRAVDPQLGTIEQFVELISAAHDLGLRLLIDVIPNHTSDRHPWFQAALDSPPGSAERDRYLFLDGRSSGPPSDWLSQFGGSAWTQVPDGQWYCHVFAAQQPDLNWANECVREYFRDTLRFWADLGVDGFRVDAAHCPVKDLTEPLRSRPDTSQVLPTDGSDPMYDRDGVHDIYREWRRVLDEYEPPRAGVAEAWWPTNSRTYLYARPDELGQVFDFSLLKSSWDRDEMAEVIRRSLAGSAGVGSLPTWVLSSHDVVRATSRYALPPHTDIDTWLRSDGLTPPADAELGRARARAAALLMLALPGCAYLFQGEELGLLEVADLAPDQLRDPIWARTGHRLKGRDGCRVPLPWTPTGISFGFSAGPAWLPQPAWFADCAVETLTGCADGVLEMYRTALQLRRRHSPMDPSVRWVDSEPDTLHLVRSSGWHCVVNFSDRPKQMPSGTLLLSSQPHASPTVLGPATAAWLMDDGTTRTPGSTS